MEEKIKTSLLPGPTVVVVDEVEGPGQASASGWRVSPCTMMLGIMLVLAATACSGAALMVGISNAESQGRNPLKTPLTLPKTMAAGGGPVVKGDKDDDIKVKHHKDQMDSDLYYDMNDADNLYYDLYYEEDEVKKMLEETSEDTEDKENVEVESKRFLAEKYDHSEEKEYENDDIFVEEEKEYAGPQEIDIGREFANAVAKVKMGETEEYPDYDMFDEAKLASVLGYSFTKCVKNRQIELEGYFDEELDEDTLATLHKKAVADCAEEREPKLKPVDENEEPTDPNKVYYNGIKRQHKKKMDPTKFDHKKKAFEQGKDHLSLMLNQCMDELPVDAALDKMAAISEKLSFLAYQEEGLDESELLNVLEPCARGQPGVDVVGKLEALLQGV